MDLDRLEANVERMSRRVARLGARLRPHVKTHKTVEAARLAVRGHFGGITVSTFAEARAFLEAGFDDVLHAVPLAPVRAREAVALARDHRGSGGAAGLQLLVDSHAALDALEAALEEPDVPQRLGAWLKFDCGYGRAGVQPESTQALELARRLASAERVDWRGVLTHAGHAYDASGREEIARVAHEERECARRFARRLAEAGCKPPATSIGSTPTLAVAEELEGIDEVRPGNYVLFDRFQATIGSCELDDVALHVLTSVIGHYPERGELLLDAGALALSKDPGAVHVDPACGFGGLERLDGTPLAGLEIHALSQEHGKVRATTPEGRAAFDELGVGALLRVVPNHSCLTAAGFERHHVHRAGRLVDEWRPIRCW